MLAQQCEVGVVDSDILAHLLSSFVKKILIAHPCLIKIVSVSLPQGSVTSMTVHAKWSSHANAA